MDNEWEEGGKNGWIEGRMDGGCTVKTERDILPKKVIGFKMLLLLPKC